MRSWRLIWRTDGIVPYLAAPASFKRLLGGERTARQFNKRRAGGALRDPLLGEAELLHEVAAIPEQPLVIHAPVDPVANGYHPDCEALASGMLVPSGRGMGRVKVPVMTPVTAV